MLLMDKHRIWLHKVETSWDWTGVWVLKISANQFTTENIGEYFSSYCQVFHSIYIYFEALRYQNCPISGLTKNMFQM